MIEAQRQARLDDVLNALYTAIDYLRTGFCNTLTCDALRLGTLIKHLKAIDLLQSRPAKPVIGIKVEELMKEISGFEMRSCTQNHTSFPMKCPLSRLMDEMKRVGAYTVGLGLPTTSTKPM
jgi:hypothetical protein